MENLTKEQIEKSISSAFDSVNLINNLNLLTDKTEDDIYRININIKHLNIMMSKDWFINNLSKEQKENINKICGNSY